MRNFDRPVQTVRRRAEQQPDWDDLAEVERVRLVLSEKPPLVDLAEVRDLRTQLARVANDKAHVIQAGDCAEDPAESTSSHVARKTQVLDRLAEILELRAVTPVIRVGRIGGQYAKPRSSPTERVGSVDLPVFRGHMVNAPEAEPALRRPDPTRILDCHGAAMTVLKHLRERTRTRVWASHEALLLDYEEPMVREQDGVTWLASTHWPWIGDRTRHPDGAHVALLAQVANPVACKIGPSTSREEILALCARLDPMRDPGRLTLIARMGAKVILDQLPALVDVVRAEGFPVIWLCDPMHGNTVRAPNGKKTRVLDTIIRELELFHQAVAAGGRVAGGVHLETTPDDVLECVATADDLDLIGNTHTMLCDPRLNLDQAVRVVSTWPSIATRRHHQVLRERKLP